MIALLCISHIFMNILSPDISTREHQVSDLEHSPEGRPNNRLPLLSLESRFKRLAVSMGHPELSIIVKHCHVVLRQSLAALMLCLNAHTFFALRWQDPRLVALNFLVFVRRVSRNPQTR